MIQKMKPLRENFFNEKSSKGRVEIANEQYVCWKYWQAGEQEIQMNERYKELEEAEAEFNKQREKWKEQIECTQNLQQLEVEVNRKSQQLEAKEVEVDRKLQQLKEKELVWSHEELVVLKRSPIDMGICKICKRCKDI